MLQPSDTDLAYLAGMIDADGYITICKTVRNGRPYYTPQVGIAGTRRQPHDFAASFWGGNVGLYHPKNPAHRGQYQWCRSGAAAIPVIVAIRPHLLVKAAQADLAIHLWLHLEDGRADDPYPEHASDYDPTLTSETLRAEMIDLNQSRRRVRSDLLFGIKPAFPEVHP